MRILYYTWDEIIKNDVVMAFDKTGHDVTLLTYNIKSYVKDVGFLETVEKELKRAKDVDKPYDFIFSCNFLPVLSKVALRNRIPYVSWTYDSPCMTMYSEMIFNPYNYMFHFDCSEVERIRNLGVEHIYHLPLAVNTDRIGKLINDAKADMDSRLVNSGVEFMGNLYNNEVDFLQSLPGLPDYEKGYIEGIELAQLTMQGCELLEEMFDERLMERLGKYAHFSREEEFFIKDRDLILNIIKKNISSRERISIIREVGKRLPMTLYTQSSKSNIPGVSVYGYIDYEYDMPLMFANSAINLNITLRNIRTGIPLRALDIMGAGGFLLTNYCPELSEFMVDGEDFVAYSDENDCCEKAAYYLRHEDERRRIAQNGREKTAKYFNYDVQIGKMTDVLRKELAL